MLLLWLKIKCRCFCIHPSNYLDLWMWRNLMWVNSVWCDLVDVVSVPHLHQLLFVHPVSCMLSATVSCIEPFQWEINDKAHLSVLYELCQKQQSLMICIILMVSRIQAVKQFMWWFWQVVPVLVTRSLMERMRNNFMVLEVWDKKTSAQNDQVSLDISFVGVCFVTTDIL